jgi:hypothetical protein
MDKRDAHSTAEQPPLREEWVVWNGSAAILAMACMGKVEVGASGRRHAWLDRPFDMVGPFDLDELESEGLIHFAACMVMSRQKWQEAQVELRQEAYAKRRAAQERMEAEQAQRFHHGSRRGWHPHRKPVDERVHRAALNLPDEGPLQPAQIKAAFRKLAQKAHPDVGGSHEQFVSLTEARNALMARFA